MNPSGTKDRAGVDPRWYQIGSLTFLLLYGLIWLRFDLGWKQAALTLGSTLVAQAIFCRIWHARVELKSALISGLSLCLLLRTNEWWITVAAAAIAIGSKYVLRWDGRHLFNPTNFALVVLLALFPQSAWVSPGQWGSFAFFAFLMLCLGSVVVNRAARTDVTVAFLGFYIALVVARSLWLGDPWSIPVHKLKHGALLLFAFFMISDPKTTPDSRPGRIVFAFLVAFGAAYVQFKLFRNNGMLWSLGLFTLTVPILNLILPGKKYEWTLPKERTAKTFETMQPVKLIYETATH
jgi:enediyne biosynthesis protein E5